MGIDIPKTLAPLLYLFMGPNQLHPYCFGAKIIQIKLYIASTKGNIGNIRVSTGEIHHTYPSGIFLSWIRDIDLSSRSAPDYT